MRSLVAIAKERALVIALRSAAKPWTRMVMVMVIAVVVSVAIVLVLLLAPGLATQLKKSDSSSDGKSKHHVRDWLIHAANQSNT